MITRLKPLVALLTLALLLSFALCAGPRAAEVLPSAPPPAPAGARERSPVAELLSRAGPVEGRGIDTSAVARFYALRAFRLAWSGTHEAAAAAAVAISALAEADSHGLNPARYHAAILSEPAAAPLGAAAYDVLMTDGVLKYMGDVHRGQVAPEAVYRDIALPSKTFDAAAALARALERGDLPGLLASLPPPHPEYDRLKHALAHYRRLAAQGGWPALPPRVIQGGDDVEPLIRARLAREDPSLAAGADITEAVRRYQSRNGLAPDGKLGPKTLAMLNVSAAGRVAQIEANLERWRWLPAVLGSRHVAINAADATVEVIDQGRTMLRSRVIVGAPRTRTPILRAVAQEVTVNPPWNVPASIARNEILPKLRRDPNYLASQRMVLLDGPPGDPHGRTIDWAAVSASRFSYRIRQLPGASNALGALKIEMPNPFNVYLHDTPGRSAFARQERALSHGCVRVEEILQLASLLVSATPEGAAADLRRRIAGGNTERIPLPEPVPVYFLYWTAVAGDGGTVGFRPDIYGRDRPLTEALRRAQAS